MSTVLPDAAWKQRFRRHLRAWYQAHARNLPWRGTRDPYAIWVSEIMLQQTQVATVIPYYQRFLAEFPTIAALASASEEDVLRRWEGLGYYRRARQLHAAARQIMSRYQGEFPTQPEDVRALPGIGRYTAGAILSIARDAREPILEANTERLLCRLLAYRGDPRKTAGQQTLWSFAEAILPRKQVGDFNQALMELGSEVCTPANPACSSCPVASQCPTQEQGLQARIPLPKRKVNYEQLREAAVVVRRRSRVLLRQCQDDERWAGLWDFPRFEIEHLRGRKLHDELVQRTADLTGVQIEVQDRLITFRYGVTRFRITLSCYQATCANGLRLGKSLRWVGLKDLADVPLSVTGRRIGNLLAGCERTASGGGFLAGG
jgi:A/G-specific adenine glycosylase